MKSQTDLLSWLSRPHLGPLDALRLSIRVWNSIDYTNLSKYEVIVKFFCEKLTEIGVGGCLDPESESVVREFVRLKYPVGVVTSETKTLLLDTLIERLESVVVLKSALENQFFVSFFSSNVSVYGRLMAKCLVAWRLHLEQKMPEETLDEEERRISEELLRNLKEFSQYQANNSTFRKIYLQGIHQQLTELVIHLSRRRMNWKREFFTMLRGIFYEESGKWYRDYFQSPEKVENPPEDRLLFHNLPLHVSLMNIEGFLFAFHAQKDLSNCFIEFLFREIFTVQKMDFSDLVLTISHTMCLMKSYSVRLEVEISHKILVIVQEFAETHTKDCLSLILSAMQLNPVIFVEDLSSLIVKFLFVPKNEEILRIFSQFFAVSLETFQKMSRFEKMLNKLLEQIHSAGNSLDFPKKLKRKLKEKPESPTKRRKINKVGDFLEILCEKLPENPQNESEEWTEISFAWSEEISLRFSRIILSLTPNASLLVWKGLIFNVQSALEATKERQMDENSLFFLEFTIKMLCSYLRGCRLLERPDNVIKKIDERRFLMKNLFGKFLEADVAGFHSPINERMFRAFLELYSSILDFEAALVVYRPDMIEEGSEESFKKINYLDKSSWETLKSKEGTNSIHLKLLKLKHIEKTSQENPLEDNNEILNLETFRSEGFWLVRQLSRQKKIDLAELLIENLKFMDDERHREVFEDQEFLSIFMKATFQHISGKINSKKSLFCKINFSSDDFPDIPSPVKSPNLTGKIDSQEIHEILQRLKDLPIGFLNKEEKNKILSFLLLLIHSLVDFEDIEATLLDILTNLTELGNEVDVFTFIPIRKIAEMFPNALKQGKLYEILFQAATNYQTDANIAGFTDLVDFLEEDHPICRDLCLIAVKNFSKSRKFHKFEKDIIKIGLKLTSLALKFFESVQEDETLIPAFTATLSAFFSNKENLTKTHEALGEMSMRFAMEACSVELLMILVDHREALKIPQESLSAIVLDFWKRMKNADMATILVNHCTTEEFQDVLKDLKETKPELVCGILQNLGSSMSEEKGNAFSMFYEEISWGITSELSLKSTTNDSMALILDVLKAHTIVVKNKKIPLPSSLFNNILIFLVEINLKRLKTNIKDFASVHLSMTELCHAINQHRSTCLKLAMPQFVTIFKDLVHGICGYRSDRSKKEKLEQDEVETLTSLAHKLEQMIAFMASKNKNAKRVAPFMLVFVINEMIYNQNSTTLNPNIKTHINNICYSLISMCDPNYGQFILRSCSEASRSVYKGLLKEYERYYKFHGKV